GLQRIEPTVESYEVMIVPGLLTMVAEHFQLGCQVAVVGRDEPTVAEAAEVLGRIEAEAGGRADRAGADAVVFGPNRLARVFYDWNATGGAGDLLDLLHFGALAEEVDRDDRLRVRADFVEHVGRVDVERVGLDIGEHGLRAKPPHGTRRGEEREA